MLTGRLQDINIIDPAYLKRYTHNLFYPAPAPKKTAGAGEGHRAHPACLDRHRGRVQRRQRARAGPRRLARRWSRPGTSPARSATPPASRQPVKPGTQVFYGTGTAANAAKIAR